MPPDRDRPRGTEARAGRQSGPAGGAALSATEAVKASYQAEVTDEFVLPTAIGNYDGMQENDGVIFSIMDDTNNLEKKIMRFLNIGNLENYILKFSTTNINISEYIDTILKTLATLDPTTYDYNRRMYVHLNPFELAY